MISLNEEKDKRYPSLVGYKNQEISYGSYFIIKDGDCIYVPDENLPMIKNLLGLNNIERNDNKCSD